MKLCSDCKTEIESSWTLGAGQCEKCKRMTDLLYFEDGKAKLSYLSFSSIRDFLHCAEMFRLKRVEKNYPEKEPAFARDVGIAFDRMITVSMGGEKEHEDLPSEAISVGAELHSAYIRAECLDRTKATPGDDIKTVLNGVPFYARLDARVLGTPLDYKVNGANCRIGGNGASPKKGWVRKVKWKGYLDKYETQDLKLNLEAIDKFWAMQTCFYNFAIQAKLDTVVGPIDGMRGLIEQVAVRKKAIQFVSYDSVIGMPFQEWCWGLLPMIWETIAENSWPFPDYEPRKCNPFGRCCDVADLCEVYDG